jgi:hypothetical protein
MYLFNYLLIYLFIYYLFIIYFTTYLFSYLFFMTASVLKWSEFMAADPEVPGSIPSATRFSAWQLVWNGIYSPSWG